jgi:hypothetical protein
VTTEELIKKERIWRKAIREYFYKYYKESHPLLNKKGAKVSLDIMHNIIRVRLSWIKRDQNYFNIGHEEFKNYKFTFEQLPVDILGTIQELVGSRLVCMEVEIRKNLQALGKRGESGEI